ncbi:MAG: hypothetical protein HY865_08995 [Chloroflexi bacterium]|nr:hypothetical protein [Chloroflexota bacterium]
MGRPKGGQAKSYNHSPATVQEAWFHLASSVLIYAIEDARSNPDPRKRAWAREWLLSKDAQFLFEMVMSRIDMIKIREWVLSGCPVIDSKKKNSS